MIKKQLQSVVFSEKKKKHQKIPFLSGYALKTGIHVGHKSLRLSKTNFWHPLMSQYFLGIRYGISLLNPVQTRKSILRAFYMIALVLKTKNSRSINSNLFFDLDSNLERQISSNFGSFLQSKKESNLQSKKERSSSLIKNKNKNKSVFFLQSKKESKFKNLTQQKQIQRKGHILIVNTNPEFSRLCKNLSVLTLHNKKDNFLLNINTSSFSYVHYKWVGGTLTNWKQVSKSVLTYAKFAERCEKFLYHNNIDFPRYKKIKECFHGLITKKQSKIYLAFNEKPDLVFLMNPNENKHIIAEANKMHVPVIALVESNSCLKGISYPIPANAYSAFFIYYCLKKMIKLSSF